MDEEAFYQKNSKGLRYFEQNNRIELAMRVLKERKISSLVDFGCGDGEFLIRMKEALPGLRIAGVDISADAVELARKKGVDAQQHNFNRGATSLSENSFEACFLGEVIEHVFSPDDLLLEIHRILKPGGWLFLTTPNLASWFNRISLLLGYQPIFTEVSTRANAGHIIALPGEPAGHIRMFTHRALCELLERFEFTIVRSYGIGLNPHSKSSLAPLYKVFNAIFAHPSIIVALESLLKNKIKRSYFLRSSERHHDTSAPFTPLS